MRDSLKCNVIVEFIFGMQINIKAFYKLILSFCVHRARHVQTTRNKKFTYLPSIPRKTVDEVDFLPAHKHKRVLQVDSITLGLRTQVCPKYSK